MRSLAESDGHTTGPMADIGFVSVVVFVLVLIWTSMIPPVNSATRKSVIKKKRKVDEEPSQLMMDEFGSDGALRSVAESSHGNHVRYVTQGDAAKP